MMSCNKNYLTILAIPIACIGYQLTRYIVKSYQNYTKKKKLDKILTDYLNNRKKQIEEFKTEYEKYVSAQKQAEILSYITAFDLSKAIKSGSFSVKEVIVTYLLRALNYGDKNKWIADFNLKEAIDLADKLDNLFKETHDKSKLPALFGMPISIKENINIKNYKSTFSYIKFLSEERSEDSYLVKVLKEKGAVPFIKSNVPQGYMAFDSWCNIYGRAVNPWHYDFIAGGSSGGECGLIASKCSVLGFGSDFGGSIRIPSACCGVYGFKPTSTRISKSGSIGFDGTRNIVVPLNYSSYGPIARTSNDLIQISKELFGNFKDDSSCLTKEFNNELLVDESVNIISNKKTIRVGFFLDNPFFESAKAIKAQISRLISIIKENNSSNNLVNYEFIEISDKEINMFFNDQDSLFYKSYELLMNSYTIERIQEQLEGEDEMYFIKHYLKLNQYSNFRKTITYYFNCLIGNKRKFHYYANYKTLNSVREYMDLMTIVQKKKFEFFEYFKTKKVDVFLFPTLPYPALHKQIEFVDMETVIMKFSYLFNIMDFPSVSMPIGLLNDCSYETKHNDNLSNIMKELLEKSLGMPVSIQIASYSGDDELVLKVMKDFDEVNYFTEKLDSMTKTRYE